MSDQPLPHAAEAALPPANCSADERPRFELARFNPRRAARGVEAAEVKVIYPDGIVEYLWMSADDIMENIETWGRCNGLAAALDAYQPNK